MSLGALSFYDIKVSWGWSRSWSWKREGIACGVDISTFVILGILAALVATGLLQTHFPVGPAVMHNPVFWSLVGGCIAILAWDVVMRLIWNQERQRAVPLRHNPIPVEFIPTSTIERSTIALATTNSNEQKSVIPHLIGSYPEQTDLSRATFALTLLPCGLEISFQGQWEEQERTEINRFFRTTIWQNYDSIMSPFYLGLPKSNILKTKFNTQFSLQFPLTIYPDSVRSSTKNFPLVTYANENATVTVFVCPAHLYKSDGHNWSIQQPMQADWFNILNVAHTQPTSSFFKLPLDVIRIIFERLPLKSQISLASSCRYFSQITGVKSQWYQKIYLPPRTLFKNISAITTLRTWFANWAKVCSVAAPTCVYSSNSSDAPSIWDLQDWLPTIWPQDELCVCGTIQGAYFYSIGLNIDLENGIQWGALTAFCFIDCGLINGLLFPNPLVKSGARQSRSDSLLWNPLVASAGVEKNRIGAMSSGPLPVSLHTIVQWAFVHNGIKVNKFKVSAPG